jgi:hypothetical protein
VPWSIVHVETHRYTCVWHDSKGTVIYLSCNWNPTIIHCWNVILSFFARSMWRGDLLPTRCPAMQSKSHRETLWTLDLIFKIPFVASFCILSKPSSTRHVISVYRVAAGGVLVAFATKSPNLATWDPILILLLVWHGFNHIQRFPIYA